MQVPRAWLFGVRVLGAAVAVLCGVAGTARAAPRRLPLTRWDAAATERARAGAMRRLAGEKCQALFSDFRDGQGRTLQESLETWGMGAVEYVKLVPFIDGTSQPLCRRSKVALVTTPGVARIEVCRAFADVQVRQPRLAQTMVIHEILHTLGLGENPPSSIEITQRVEARCP